MISKTRASLLQRIFPSRRTFYGGIYLSGEHISATRVSILPFPNNAAHVEDNTNHPLPADIEGFIEAAQRAGLPLAQQLREAASTSIEHLIINAIPQEPIMTSGPIEFAQQIDAFLDLADALGKVLRAKSVWLALDRGDKELVKRCRIASASTAVQIRPLKNKYPQSFAPLLVQAITGREVPYGSTPIDIGALVIEATTMAALIAAIRHPERPWAPVVIVGGNAAMRPGAYRIPVGTRLADIIQHVGLKSALGRVIDGGMMTGRAVYDLDAVVTNTTSAILLLDKDSDGVPSPGPCIRCGWCQEDCPVGLDPLALLDLYERSKWAQAERFRPLACINCGICSYICPTELPLAEAVAQLKTRAVVTGAGSGR